MKKIVLLPLLFFVILCQAQKNKAVLPQQSFSKYSYLSFNPFALAEPQFAIGLGYGNRFTERSEVFTELSYVAKHPSYKFKYEKLNGYRFLAEYRYHFLQQWKPIINLGDKHREKNRRSQPFIGLQFRLKGYQFIDRANFTNNIDTLLNYRYIANAISLGGAITFGATYNISKNKRWQLEVTTGIGAKQKFVNYKNLPTGYKVVEEIKAGFIGLRAPDINEAEGTPVFPSTIRIRYMLN
jgi:Protein of unknown function (DUF3575)